MHSTAPTPPVDYAAHLRGKAGPRRLPDALRRRDDERRRACRPTGQLKSSREDAGLRRPGLHAGPGRASARLYGCCTV